MAATNLADTSRIILVFDGLERIIDQDGAPDLKWLTANLPKQIRLIGSTKPGRALEELKRLGWSELRLKPLSFSARQEMIERFLAKYSKKLSPEQVELIAKSDQSGTC